MHRIYHGLGYVNPFLKTHDRVRFPCPKLQKRRNHIVKRYRKPWGARCKL